MIGVDTSVVIPWFNGGDYPEVARFDALLRRNQVCIAPVTATELLSGVDAGEIETNLVEAVFWLPMSEGYWERAGALRSKVRRSDRRAKLADALIAQACMDADVPLLTRDGDFKGFAELGGLRLA